MSVPIVCFFTVKSKWKLKTVDEFKFQHSARLHMKSRTRSGAIVLPEDSIEGRTLVIDKVVYQFNPGDAIAIRHNLTRLLERLERLR